ncbi:hypothetical protein DAEQUDRAFT_713106 [Daedalea quercina L-15889]|uniref:CBF1-interacting co-repressor CIR N-terminal domain-containing protein n=1 Tax=Daedalea quercina L-15889 TaxID=1314783 RepID=A0A165P091_9APHY|nr:hypothetical protein DAEQUDRAFT_713106 [Daedalea quercina L-15889]
MGKLNIAHHKSYHPYRRDNIERVRQDEEEARLKEAVQEGRMMLADSEARMDLLRQRAGLASRPTTKRSNEEEDFEAERSEKTEVGPSSITSGGHINLFEDIERQMIPVHGRSTKKSAPETEKGIPLAPTEKDLKPWYSDRSNGKGQDKDQAREMREIARKSVNDPLTSINHRLSARSSGTSSTASTSRSRPSHSDRPPSTPSEPRSAETARLNRESAERQRALELIRRKKREMAGSETPSTVHGGVEQGYRDVFNRREVEEARRYRERRWDEDRRDKKNDHRARW